MNEKVGGIILAAGASVRMGKTKQLLPVGNGILIERVLNEALSSDLDKVVLVLGHRAEAIRKALGKTIQHPKLKVVENTHYKQGISSSIRAGLPEVAEFGHAMILLGDMPYVQSRLINLLLRQYLDSGLSIGAIEVKSRRTHPVIFSRQLYAELHQLKGDVGAKPLFTKYRHKLCLVKPAVDYDDRDIDTQEEYHELRHLLTD